MTRLCAAAGVVLALAAAGRAQQAPPATLAGVVFEDQFERRNEVTAYRGDVVVILYGDRRGATANKALGEKLYLEFHPQAAGLPADQAKRVPPRPVPGRPAGTYAPNVQVIPAASLGGVPSLIRPVIRNQFRKGSPDVPVWLDFDDHLKTRFGLTAGAVNLVVVDAAGRPRFKVAGEPNAEQYAKLVQVIDAFRAEAVTPAAGGPPPVLKPPMGSLPAAPPPEPEGPELPAK